MALWGRLRDQDVKAEHREYYHEQLARRRSFSRWLAENAARSIQEEVGQAQPSRHMEAIFSYLTGNCISDACRLAQKSGKTNKRSKGYFCCLLDLYCCFV